QCYKQGADAHENPGVGVSLNSRAARLAAISYRPCWHVCPAGRHRIWPRYAGKATTQKEEGMIIALYIVAAVIMAIGSLYLAWQNREFRKFLAGAFFVSSGILFYLYRRCFGASVGDKFCRNTSDQRWPLHRPFHPLLALFLFWLRQEASGLKRTPSHVDVEAPCLDRSLG